VRLRFVMRREEGVRKSVTARLLSSLAVSNFVLIYLVLNLNINNNIYHE